MANFGKIIIPLGIVLAIVGGIIGPNYVVGLIPMIIGIVMIVVGLPRVVQGKDRKIMGRIVDLKPRHGALPFGHSGYLMRCLFICLEAVL